MRDSIPIVILIAICAVIIILLLGHVLDSIESITNQLPGGTTP